MRLKANDHEYREWLMKIANGEAISDENGDIQVPPPLICSGNIADAIFGDAFSGKSMDLSGGWLYLPPEIEDEARKPSDALNFPTEFLNKMTPTGMPPHALHLKVGCIVMLLRNIDVRNGLCNGTRLIFASTLWVRKGSEVLLPKIDCYFSHNLPFRLRRRQFPIRLSFAMTINKSQGQSFSKVGIALHDPIFAHGQLYVALSRTRSSGGVIIEALKNLMRNIVCNEVLI
ncbi:unnamed protein product [Heligmosomoides polygyrus]|uniref:ATP-dependent DNA helicase n=1 Tax=Heligmosomoides polygyrus TaxID=6339 RepID=A0A183GGB5_HELPZ|nr:unnamed protein product [Heligmosomoides polygyrus]